MIGNLVSLNGKLTFFARKKISQVIVSQAEEEQKQIGLAG